MRETPGAQHDAAQWQQWSSGQEGWVCGVWCVSPQSLESGHGTSHMEPPTPARTQHTAYHPQQPPVISRDSAVAT